MLFCIYLSLRELSLDDFITHVGKGYVIWDATSRNTLYDVEALSSIIALPLTEMSRRKL